MSSSPNSGAVATQPELKAKDAPDLSSFAWDDALLLNGQLSEDERMLRDSAQQFAAEQLQPKIIDAYREEKTDSSIFQAMGEMGLLGVTIPEAYGGLGGSYVSYGLIAREIERGGQWLSLDDVCAVKSRHVSDLCLWHGRAAAISIYRSLLLVNGLAVLA